MKLLCLAVCTLLLSGCFDTNQQEPQSIPVVNTDILQSVPVKSFPVNDSTDFDNYQLVGKQNDKLASQLQLGLPEEAQGIRFNYSVPFSEKYKSVVITYINGEHELYTTLVNINAENQVIDKLTIAYDEIAESAFKKNGILNKEKILVEEWNYMSDEPVKEIKTYTIDAEGHFKEQ